MAETGVITASLSETVALGLAGLTLLGFGVGALQVMARRSLSLKTLHAKQVGIDPRELFEAGIARRIPELQQHGLAQLRNGRLTPTPFGTCVLAITRLLRWLTRARL
jgi:hypothetical protein